MKTRSPSTTAAAPASLSPSASASRPSPRDFGTCGRAGRQRPADPSSVPKPIDATLTDTFGRPLDRRQRAIDASVAARRGNWIDWPGIAILPNTPDVRTFEWAAYTDDFHTGTAVCVYIAVCDGLLGIAKAARLSLAKIGLSTREDDLLARFAEMNADKYGSLHMQDGQMIETTGHDTWEPLRLLSAIAPAYPSPVERDARSLSIRLPASMPADAFDVALNGMLAPMLVSNWIETSDGRRYAALHDVVPQSLHRFTAHNLPDGSVKLKKAQEIFIFRRKEDTDKLVKGIEGLIARHLTKTALSPTWSLTSRNDTPPALDQQK